MTPDARVLDHRVDGIGKAQERGAISLGLQVEDDAAFVAIDAGEIAAVVTALAVLRMRAEKARHVAAWWLHLDHVCSQVGEQHGAERAGERLREIEDAEIGKRAGPFRHRSPQ